MRSTTLIAVLAACSPSTAAVCKSTPLDSDWPQASEWAALNRTLGGVLLQTRPIASACYPGNPFNSTLSCNEVEDQWNSTYFHATLPESIDFSLWTNSSCVPPGTEGYIEGRPCTLGLYPAYIVNGTSNDVIAKAMRWASHRNIRINVKGTGHDLDGRYVVCILVIQTLANTSQINWCPLSLYLDSPPQQHHFRVELEQD